MKEHFLLLVIPAKAGIHLSKSDVPDSRFRGNDKGALMSLRNTRRLFAIALILAREDALFILR